MRRSSTSGAERFGAWLVVFLCLAIPAEAQWTRRPPPAESPYWWTLTDSVTPAELRSALQDRERHRGRFRAAAASGRLGEVVTEQQVYEVRQFLDGQVNPELVPMYLAFESFAARFDYLPGWSDESSRMLAEYGMTSAGVQQLVAAAARYGAARDQILEEVREPVAELMEILRPHLRDQGNERLMTMLVAGDIDRLATLTGRDPDTLARLHAAWKREPIADAALPALVQLRDSLTREDWSAFRGFLLAEVAPSIWTVEYRKDGPR